MASPLKASNSSAVETRTAARKSGPGARAASSSGGEVATRKAEEPGLAKSVANIAPGEQSNKLMYMGNLGIRSYLGREPINKMKQKQFADFETQLAMDFVFGDDATRAGAKASVDGFSTENGNEEVKQP